MAEETILTESGLKKLEEELDQRADRRGPWLRRPE